MALRDSTVLPADFSAQIDALFASWAGNDKPGAVVGVRHNGRTVHLGGYGMANLPHRVPLTGDSLIRIGSQTKQFTVLLALMLEVEGRLSFQDDVRLHLPWLPVFPHTVTLQDLAANVSGLRDYVEFLELGGQSPLSPCPRPFIKQVIGAHPGTNFAAGDDMLYCNTGFFLLYEVIEKVAGRPFGDLLRARITGPLGMNHTHMMLHDDEILPHLADHHTRGSDGAWRRAWTGEETSGDGGIVSSTNDMLTWLSHLNAPTIFGTALARMAKPGAIINGVPSPYCLGLIETHYKGDRNIGHSGGMAGGRSEGVRFPELGLDIVILGNTDEIRPFSLARRIVDLAMGRAAGPPHAPAAAAHLKAAAGLYHDDATGDVFALVTQGDTPRFTNTSGTYEVEQLTPKIFTPEFGVLPLNFTLRPDGDITATRFGRMRHYKRLSRHTIQFDGQAVGRYGDAALGITAEISVENDIAWLTIKTMFTSRRCGLEAIAPNVALARTATPAAGTGGDGAKKITPWRCAVSSVSDAIVINTEWTRNLRLPRIPR